MVIVLNVPLTRAETAAGYTPVAPRVVARIVECTSSCGTAARASPESAAAIPDATGARPRRESLSAI